MTKIVQFKIGAGDFERGFLVSLRIQVNHQPDIEIDGELPPAPEIPQLYRDWQAAYGTQGLGVYRALEVVEEEVTHISVQDSAKALEMRLNDWLNGADGGFRPVREGVLSYLQERDRIRFLIRANDNILWQLPWHLCDLFQRYPHSDIALHIAQNPLTPVHRPHQTHVRLLTILGEATDINVDADLNLLQDSLPDDAKILEPLIASRRETIDNALWQQQADILFFAGHSTSRQAGRFFINETESLTIEDLKYALKRAISQGLKLAIFNSCDGLQLAKDLADLQIPAIIVMRERIPDEAAQRFLEYFLAAFAQEQKPLYTAVREARERLHGLENRYPCVSWLPVLCQHPQGEELSWPKMRQGEERGEKLPVSRPQSGFRPVSWGKRVQLGMLATVLVTGGIVGLRSLSRLFTHQGVNCFKTSRYDCAQSYLQWALRLNPHNAKARNNLGVVYGALQEDAKARQLFKQSKIQGNPAACNNAAHDHIKTGEYAAATNLLQVCLQQVLTTESELGEYVIRKNLGWSLFEQGYYDEAEKHLRFALSINQQFQKEGPANCVLAQVLDAKNQPQAALPQWQHCLNARDSIPEEAEWKRLAKQQLQAQTH